MNYNVSFTAPPAVIAVHLELNIRYRDLLPLQSLGLVFYINILPGWIRLTIGVRDFLGETPSTRMLIWSEIHGA